MNCDMDHEVLSAYLDDALSKAERDEVGCHVTLCSQCQDVLTEWSGFASSIQGLLDSQPPLNLESRVMARIAANHQALQASRLSWVYIYLALVSGGLMFVVLVSPFGTVFRAMVHLALATVRGGMHMTTLMGSLWWIIIMTCSVLVIGLSIVGMAGLNRSARSEVVV